MIQFNLLPNVKVEFIKTKKLKRLIIGVSFAAVIFSVALLILMFSFKAVQSAHLSNLDSDINKLKAELESTPDLNNMISVQNQLDTLPALYTGRPAVYRLPGYLDQTTPTDIGLTSTNIDFTTSKVSNKGIARNLESVNRYVDTLKFTKYKVGDEGEEMDAFTNVVLTTFGKGENEASFDIAFDFNPAIFDEAQDVRLVIPSIVTTRSQVQSQSSNLFNGTTDQNGEQ